MRNTLIIFFITLFTSTACQFRDADSEQLCPKGCKSGEVCVASKCNQLCNENSENACTDIGKICNAENLCVDPAAGIPEITLIDGNSGELTDLFAPEGLSGNSAAHRIRNAIVIHGRHLQDTQVQIVAENNQTITVLASVVDDSKILAPWPEQFQSGTYLLRVVNSSGVAEQNITILQGETGVNGNDGPIGPSGPEGLQGPAGATGGQGEMGPMPEFATNDFFLGSGALDAKLQFNIVKLQDTIKNSGFVKTDNTGRIDASLIPASITHATGVIQGQGSVEEPLQINLELLKTDLNLTNYVQLNEFGQINATLLPESPIIQEDLQIHVAASNADFENIPEALNWLKQKLILPSATATIQVAAGTYEHASPIIFDHPNGDRIEILGDVDEPDNVKLYFPNSSGLEIAHGRNLRLFAGFHLQGNAHAAGSPSSTGVWAKGNNNVMLFPDNGSGSAKIKISDFTWGLFAALGAFVDARYIHSFNNTNSGISAYRNATIFAQQSQSYNNGSDGYRSAWGAYIHANNARSVENESVGFYASHGSTLQAQGSESYQNNDGYRAWGNAYMHINNASSAYDNTNMGIRADLNSFIYAPETTSINSGTVDIFANYDSIVHVNDSTCEDFTLDSISGNQSSSTGQIGTRGSYIIH